MLRCFLISLLLIASVSGQVPLGATKQEVVDKLGWPKSTSGTAEREIMNYADFTVLLTDGRVEKLEFKPGKQKPAGSYKAPVQKVLPSNPVQPRKTTPTEPLSPAQNRMADPTLIVEPRTQTVPINRAPS